MINRMKSKPNSYQAKPSSGFKPNYNGKGQRGGGYGDDDLSLLSINKGALSGSTTRSKGKVFTSSSRISSEGTQLEAQIAACPPNKPFVEIAKIPITPLLLKSLRTLGTWLDDEVYSNSFEMHFFLFDITLVS
jgi:hypothetical protein